MTSDRKVKKRREKAPPIIGLLVIVLLICPAFLFPKEISEGILFGIKLCVFNIIPSVFPFFVIADAVFALSGSLGESFLGKIFSRIFNLPKEAFGAFVLGNICGFPLGVKGASELYAHGALTKKEAEYLIGFSNNPSAAFVITAVGLGMFGSIRTGLALYSVLIISAVITGLIFRGNCIKSDKTRIISRQKFKFVESVKNAGISSITVSSYIIFFSAVSGLVLNLFGDGIIGLLGVMLSEVSGGVSFISTMPFFGIKTALVLSCVTLSFSGFSVHLQSRSLAAKELSFFKYYIMKITQAVISAMIMLIISAYI